MSNGEIQNLLKQNWKDPGPISEKTRVNMKGNLPNNWMDLPYQPSVSVLRDERYGYIMKENIESWEQGM